MQRPGEYADELALTLLTKSVDEFCRSANRFLADHTGSLAGGQEFLFMRDRLNLLLAIHADTVQVWAEKRPEIRDLIDSLLSRVNEIVSRGGEGAR
jgi:hypothetical protein